MKNSYGVSFSYETGIDQPDSEGTALLTGNLQCVVTAKSAEDALSLAKKHLESYVRISAYSLTEISVRDS